MKRKLKSLLLALLLTMTVSPQQAKADPVIAEIIRQGIIKVIKAVDLKIQRLQLNTIWLQNTQKTIENVLSKLKLDEISEWTEKQRELFGDYYDELWKVKNIITQYQRIRDIARNQTLLINEYQTVWNLLRQSQYFSIGEIRYMENVYTKILESSLNNMEQIYIVASSFRTQMSDAERLELIHRVDRDVRNNLADLRRFNRQNIGLDSQRGGNLKNINIIQEIYGL
ncbi:MULTISPECIES: conjugal transfer protein TraI [Cyclobacteriaceae]|uniref:Conjugal transfer protein TraI n=2 Tax=Cyclobacteriaceae TaxID=563798 RepID=A0ABV9T0Y6_9BACT